MSAQRCECCDSVLDDLRMMRKSFDKLKKEMVRLRRDATKAMAGGKPANKIKECPESRAASPLAHTKTEEQPVDPFAGNSDVFEEPLITSDFYFRYVDPDDDTKKEKPSKDKKKTKKVKEEKEEENALDTSVPAKEQIKLKERIFPTQPFKDPKSFMIWNSALRKHKSQREQLTQELLQFNFDDPENYIGKIWRDVLHKNCGDVFTYSGAGRMKKALKECTFNDIFKDAFLKRFPSFDGDFYVVRTMRFIKCIQDLKRKALRREELAKKRGEVLVELDD